MEDKEDLVICPSKRDAAGVQEIERQTPKRAKRFSRQLPGRNNPSEAMNTSASSFQSSPTTGEPDTNLLPAESKALLVHVKTHVKTLIDELRNDIMIKFAQLEQAGKKSLNKVKTI